MDAAEARKDAEQSNIIKDAISGVAKKDSSYPDKAINKRIDFDAKTMRRLEAMIPLYKDDVGEGLSKSELLSRVVCLAVNELFEGDFKSKIDRL